MIRVSCYRINTFTCDKLQNTKDRRPVKNHIILNTLNPRLSIFRQGFKTKHTTPHSGSGNLSFSIHADLWLTENHIAHRWRIIFSRQTSLHNTFVWMSVIESQCRTHYRQQHNNHQQHLGGAMELNERQFSKFASTQTIYHVH